MSNPGGQSGPDYRLQAKALWDLHGEKLRFTAQVNADYGKWLVVTITSTHFAAIYLISQTSVPVEVRSDPWSYWPFVFGLCVSLVCGLVTWANWALSAQAYSKWMDPKMLVDMAYWPTDVSGYLKSWIPVTFYIPIILGVASAACIPWGAYEVLHTRQHDTARTIMPSPALKLPAK